VLAAAEKIIVAGDTEKARQFSDQKPELEMELAKKIG
jgi:hypothetical protein